MSCGDKLNATVNYFFVYIVRAVCHSVSVNFNILYVPQINVQAPAVRESMLTKTDKTLKCDLTSQENSRYCPISRGSQSSEHQIFYADSIIALLLRLLCEGEVVKKSNYTRWLRAEKLCFGVASTVDKSINVTPCTRLPV